MGRNGSKEGMTTGARESGKEGPCVGVRSQRAERSLWTEDQVRTPRTYGRDRDSCPVSGPGVMTDRTRTREGTKRTEDRNDCSVGHRVCVYLDKV